MPSERVTIRLLDSERDGVRSWAREHGTTENYAIRIAIRRLLGLATGEPSPEPLSRVTERDE